MRRKRLYEHAVGVEYLVWRNTYLFIQFYIAKVGSGSRENFSDSEKAPDPTG